MYLLAWCHAGQRSFLSSQEACGAFLSPFIIAISHLCDGFINRNAPSLGSTNVVFVIISIFWNGILLCLPVVPPTSDSTLSGSCSSELVNNVSDGFYQLKIDEC